MGSTEITVSSKRTNDHKQIKPFNFFHLSTLKRQIHKWLGIDTHKRTEESLGTTYIAFTLDYVRIAITCSFSSQVSGGEMGASYWLALLAPGFLTVSHCAAASNTPAPMWCVCLFVCVEVRECIGIIMSHFNFGEKTASAEMASGSLRGFFPTQIHLFSHVFVSK